MTTDGWQRARSIFERVVDAPRTARNDLLDDACGDDPALRSEVAALLAHHDRADGVLERIATAGDVARAHRIGPYRLLETLGRGGMGTVYLAERDDSYHQRVAIKRIATPHAEAIVERFAHERQILATLEHPNIARLLDGGTDDDGAPYYVMEWVRGEPIDVYCQRHQLDVRAQLGLFLKVCAAVAHAHRKLIIHRDLKPANILVDENGEPKLLDFGIAKLLDDPESPGEGARGLTLSGVRPMTPGFASPEQIRGEPLTTASDVYALGVLLYTLLTQRSPYRPDDDSLTALERAICQQMPSAPSVVLATPPDGDRSPRTSAVFGNVRRRRRQLTGDLDNIVLAALRKAPARRYASVDHLADDLRRHLDGRPVHARRATLWYHGAAFVRRHKLGVAIAIALAIAGAWQQRNVVVARDRAEALAVQTARERDTATRTRDFLIDLFSAADPETARGATITARELLDRGAARLRTELDTEVEARTALLEAIGQIYGRLGEYPQAHTLLTEALDARRQAPEALEPLAQNLAALARVEFRTAAYDEAVVHYRQALDLLRRHHPGDHSDIASILDSLGSVRWAQGDADAATRRHDEALAMRRRLFAGDHPDIADSLTNRAAIRTRRQDFAGAEADHREALDIRRRVLGNDSPDVAASLSNLGFALQAQGMWAEAENHYRQALALRRRLLGDDHPDLAITLNNLASVLRDQGRHDEAAAHYREALGLRRAALGDQHPSVAISRNNLASVLRDHGQLSEAEGLFRAALDTWRTQHGDSHLTVAIGMTNLADVLRRQTSLDEAETLAQRALAILDEAVPPDHWRIAVAQGVLGGCRLDRGHHAAAIDLLEPAVERLRAAKGPDSRYARIPAADLAAAKAATIDSDS